MRPTGAIVAAPTTSLPECFGGVRNWDYRYCWLRDATFTLLALMNAGYTEEARAWRDWLLRSVAGKPEQIQIMYGIRGERRLPELELPWLAGYEESRPVRIGNAASGQRQLDVFGEVLDAIHQAWRMGVPPDANAWRVEKALVTHLESAWHEPDEGLWEVRGPRRHFTHSKMMAWVALDRAVKGIESFELEGPVDRWRSVRDAIHRDVCMHGYNPGLGAFVQSYGSDLLDASLLMMPLVGFLPISDERVRSTVMAIEQQLSVDGFVHRYRTVPDVDGLPPGEATFLLCSFWLADNLQLLGRHDDARRLFERLLSIRNDVGLLSEGYDVRQKRLAGQLPTSVLTCGVDQHRDESLVVAGTGERTWRALSCTGLRQFRCFDRLTLSFEHRHPVQGVQSGENGMADGRPGGVRLRQVRLNPSSAREEFGDSSALARRIISEFQEVPGTCLTLAQASRVFGIPGDVGERILGNLVDGGLLQLTRDGRYRLRTIAV